jgi:hypothetical protein
MDPSLHGETTEKQDINVLMHGLEIEQDGEDPTSDEKKEQSIDNVQISGSDVSEITASKDRCRPPGTYSKEPFKIEEGQRVQVVSVDDGVFQLARGVGYIVASANQLVKGLYLAFLMLICVVVVVIFRACSHCTSSFC